MEDAQFQDLVTLFRWGTTQQERIEAAEQLAVSGEESLLELFVEALHDSQPEAAIRGLGILKDPQATEPLLTLLKQFEESQQDKAAPTPPWLPAVFWALGELQDPRAVEPLLALLEHHVLDSLEGMSKVIETLGRLGDPRATGTLTRAFHKQGGSPAFLEQIIHALGLLRAIEPLRDILEDPYGHPALRIAAVDALGLTRDPRAVQPLLAQLESNNLERQRRAIRALGRLGSPKAVPKLAARLTESRQTRLWKPLIHALAQIGPPEAFRPLRDLLYQADPLLKVEAAEALADIPDPQLLILLEQAPIPHAQEHAKRFVKAIRILQDNLKHRFTTAVDRWQKEMEDGLFEGDD